MGRRVRRRPLVPGQRNGGSAAQGARGLDGRSPAVLDRPRVFGGVVLNRCVGGINPAAVEAALRLGGRCVWSLTLDADAHAKAFGSPGSFPGQRGGIESPTGIKLDDRGGLIEAAEELLALAAEHDVMMTTPATSVAAR